MNDDNLTTVQSTANIVSPWTHWMFYGPTGSGKTTAAGSFPNPLFLVPASEGSELTLASADRDVPYFKLGRDAQNNPVKVREHLNAILSMLETKHALMRKLYAEGRNDEAADAFPYETIVLESMTHLCAMLQDDISNNGAIKMDQQRWGIMSDYLRTVHTRLRGFECHVVFTALAKVDGEEGSVVEGAPDITGKMARLLPSACDAIGYCETVDSGNAKAPPVYRVHFRQHRVFPARTRFKGIPAVVNSFTFAQVEKFLPK